MDNELSVIEKELLACAKDGEPVMLHGKCIIDIESMVKKISNIIFEDEPDNICRSTMCGEETYNVLANENTGALFRCINTLLVSRLGCDPEDSKDEDCYHKLAKVIGHHRIGLEELHPEHTEFEDLSICKEAVNDFHKPVLVKWLVVYASNPNDFPPYFTKQFTKISLSDDNETESIRFNWDINDTRDVICNGQHIVKLPPLQFRLFECLYKGAGKDVDCEDLVKCWGSKIPNYENFLSDTISKLNKKLMVGLQKRHIEIGKHAIESDVEIKIVIAYKLVT